MARGFESAVYTHDDASIANVRVEADRFADAAFGWSTSAGGAYLDGDKGFKPRHVVGVEASSGRTAKAIVPDVTADVWTGTATSFVAKDDDGASHTYVIPSRGGELRHILR